MPKVYDIDAADWKSPQFAKEHDELNASYAKKEEFNNYKAFSKLKEAFKFIKEKEDFKTVCDMGCGAGWHLVYLEKEGILEGKECYGVDISPDMCKRAKKNYPNGTFITTDLTINSINKKFDVVMESAVIELVHDYKAFLLALIKHANKWIVFHRLFFSTNKTNFEQVETYNKESDIRIHVSMDELKTILDEHNFELVNVDKWNMTKVYKMGTFVARRKNA